MGLFAYPLNETIDEQIETALCNINLFKEQQEREYNPKNAYLLRMAQANLDAALKRLLQK